MNKFSIIIPTLQKNLKILTMLIEELVEVDCVGEVIVIDNSLKGLDLISEKVRVIVPSDNLYVNLSWNLGVEEAKFEFIGILNDDLLIPKNLVLNILNFIQEENVGLVGIDTNSIIAKDYNFAVSYPQNSEISYEKQENVIYIGYWGVAIFGRKSNYYKIPTDIKVWCGDNYLLKMNEDNGKVNYKATMKELYHVGSLSCASKKFDKIKCRDIDNYSKIDERFKTHDKGKKKKTFFNYIFELTNSANRKYKRLTILGLNFEWEN